MIEKDREVNLDKNLSGRIKTEQQHVCVISDNTTGRIWTSGVNKQLTSGHQQVHSLLHTRTVVQAVVLPVAVGETKMLVTVTVPMPATTYFRFRHQPLIFGGKIQMWLVNLQEKPEFVIALRAVQITIPGCPSRQRLPHHHPPDLPPILRRAHLLRPPLGPYPDPRS